MFLTQIHDRTSAAPGPGFPMDLCQLPAHRSPEEHQPFCPQRSPPVQLELLPMHPSSRSASRSGSATPVSCSTSLSWPGSASAPERPSSGQPVLHRDFDMNRMPSGDYDDVITSSPHSVMSPFNVETSARRESSSSFKRERETSQDLDLERMKNQEVSSRLSDEEDGGGTRKKLRLSKEQSALLEESFKDHSTLNPKQKNALAKQLNLSPRQVEVWFQNRRARTKLKQTEVDCELLKRCCESLTEENRRLQKELQELRAIKVAPPCVITQDYFMPLPAATLTMCPSCEKIATIDNSRTTANYAKQQYYVPQLRQSSAAC